MGGLSKSEALDPRTGRLKKGYRYAPGGAIVRVANAPETKKPSAATKKPSAPGKKPSAPGKKPSAATKKPSAPGKKPSAPGKKPTAPGKRTSAPGKRTSAPGKKPSAPGKKPSAPRKRTKGGAIINMEERRQDRERDMIPFIVEDVLEMNSQASRKAEQSYMGVGDEELIKFLEEKWKQRYPSSLPLPPRDVRVHNFRTYLLSAAYGVSVDYLRNKFKIDGDTCGYDCVVELVAKYILRPRNKFVSLRGVFRYYKREVLGLEEIIGFSDKEPEVVEPGDFHPSAYFHLDDLEEKYMKEIKEDPHIEDDVKKREEALRLKLTENFTVDGLRRLSMKEEKDMDLFSSIRPGNRFEDKQQVFREMRDSGTNPERP